MANFKFVRSLASMWQVTSGSTTFKRHPILNFSGNLAGHSDAHNGKVDLRVNSSDIPTTVTTSVGTVTFKNSFVAKYLESGAIFSGGGDENTMTLTLSGSAYSEISFVCFVRNAAGETIYHKQMGYHVSTDDGLGTIDFENVILDEFSGSNFAVTAELDFPPPSLVTLEISLTSTTASVDSFTMVADVSTSDKA